MFIYVYMYICHVLYILYTINRYFPPAPIHHRDAVKTLAGTLNRPQDVMVSLFQIDHCQEGFCQGKSTVIRS